MASLSIDQKCERAGNYSRPGMRMLRRGRGRGTEFRCHQKNVVSLTVKRHGPGAALGRDGPNRGEFLGRVLMNNSECTLTVGAECELRPGIESVRVHALADGRSFQNL